MTKKYNLHSMRDWLALAQYVQIKVFWGGFFIRKDDETSDYWKNFWDHMEGAIEDGCYNVIINDTEDLVEFCK